MPNMGPEKKIVNAILDAYREHGAFAEKIHGGPQQPRLVDIIACYRGRFIALEVKAGNGRPTPYQLHVLEDVGKADGHCGVVRSLDEALGVLDFIDRIIEVENA